jgi:malate dehydrogenase (oxaloacetate-decarboxylating)(NADP+)
MFTKEVIQLMAALNPRPIIFPLSNPVRLSECTFEDAMVHSNGRAIFASGSPFDPIGSREPHGQANNFLVFPGIGLGAILAKAAHVTDSMIEACSLGLAQSLTLDERAADLIYPRLMRVRQVTADIAVSVIRAAQKAGVDRNVALRSMDDDHLHTWVESKMWSPA